MSRRRLIILPQNAKFDPDDAIFRGVCASKTVDAYWGKGTGRRCIRYIDNGDGTYTYYAANPDKAKMWNEGFRWVNSEGVKDLHICSGVQVGELDGLLMGAGSVAAYDFGTYAIKARSLVRAFQGCKNLTILDLSHWDFSDTESFEGMFSGCESLQRVNLAGVDDTTGAVEAIEAQLLTGIPDEVKSGSVMVMFDDGANHYDMIKNKGWVPDNRVIGLVLKSSSTAPAAYNSRIAKGGAVVASKINDTYGITAADVATIALGGADVTDVIFDARCVWPTEAQTSANTFFKNCLDGLTSLKTVSLLGVDDAVVLAVKSSNFGGSNTAILGQIEVLTDKGTFIYQNSLWVLKS